jgi:alpha-mannosidase
VISVDGDSYWTYDSQTRRLTHILFTALSEGGPAPWDDWEKSITKDRLALGWHEFRHRVIVHEGDWRAARICEEADRLRFPPLVVKPLGEEAGAPPNAIGGLCVSPANVRLSAFYEDAGGYVLRLYESSGLATTAGVVLPCPFASATRTDFNLEPIDAPAILAGDKLTVPLRPWEIATVLLGQWA